MMEITIPSIPPSVNHYYGNRAMKTKTGKYRVIRYITAEGKAFKKIVEKCVKQPAFDSDTKLRIVIRLYFNDKRKRDWDNYNKALCDSLEGFAYTNDNQIKDGRVIIDNTDTFAYTKVFIEEM